MTLAAQKNVPSLDRPELKQMCRLLGWLLFLGCSAYVLPAPPPVTHGLDESWKAFLSFAFLARKHFGTEVVFTYGPWGFLLYPRNFPGIFPWVALGRLILVLGCGAGLAMLGIRWIQRPIRRVFWASAILLIAEPTYLLTALLFLFLWSECTVQSTWERISLHVVALAAGLAANTKFTCFLILLCLSPPLLLRKQSRWLALTAMVSFILFWLLAGQSLATFPAFVSTSAAIASDYSTGMVWGEAAWPDLLIALFLCGIPVLTIAVREVQRLDMYSFALSAWFFLFEFILFRQAIVRLDVHQLFMGFVAGAFPVALMMIASPHLWKFAGLHRPVLRRLFAAGVILAGTWAWFYTVGPWRRKVPNQLSQFTLEMQGRIARAKVTEPLVSASGNSVSVFPWDLSFALLNRLPLINLPVIQSYAAYSPRVSALNSQFLEGLGAPARIYFEAAPIDGRYPTLEDAMSWRSLITHYRPSTIQGSFLVLERSVHPRHFTLQPVLYRELKVGDALDIPSDAYPILWAEIRTKRTFWGRLLGACFRAPKLVLNVEASSGEYHFAFLDEVGNGGFFLSPLIDSTLAMKDMYLPSCRPRLAKPVRKISLSGRGAAGRGFSPNIEVRLFAFSTLEKPGGPQGFSRKTVSETVFGRWLE